MKKFTGIIFILITASAIALLAGCAASSTVKEKTGVQLWGENCNRCHNSPSPVDFKDVQWSKIGTHMKLRANLTDEEVKKIVAIMQASN
jgi:cytochrome c1